MTKSMASSNFVSSLYATNRKKDRTNSKVVHRDRDLEIGNEPEYHDRLKNSLYVKLVGKSVLYKKMAETYGPTFIKLKDKIVRDKTGKITSHKIFIKQVHNLKKVAGSKPWIREYKPWTNWIDVRHEGLKVDLLLSRKEVPNQPVM